jgi:hypothetical protein
VTGVTTNGYLYIVFVAPNGGSFTISGSSELFTGAVNPPPAPWSIVNATGRFADYSGSGTYTVAGLTLTGAEPLTISLEGTITIRG